MSEEQKQQLEDAYRGLLKKHESVSKKQATEKVRMDKREKVLKLLQVEIGAIAIQLNQKAA